MMNDEVRLAHARKGKWHGCSGGVQRRRRVCMSRVTCACRALLCPCRPAGLCDRAAVERLGQVGAARGRVTKCHDSMGQGASLCVSMCVNVCQCVSMCVNVCQCVSMGQGASLCVQDGCQSCARPLVPRVNAAAQDCLHLTSPHATPPTLPSRPSSKGQPLVDDPLVVPLLERALASPEIKAVPSLAPGGEGRRG